MRIFLTGASGYIGTAVLDALVRAGHGVTGLVRNAERADLVAALGGRPLLGNLDDPASYRDAALGHDGIIHTAFESSQRGASLDRDAVETLLAVCRSVAAAEGGRGALFVYTSGVWVLGPAPQPVAEEADTNPVPLVAWRPEHETLVLEGAGDGLRTIVVRPGIVYGGSRGIVSDFLRDAENGLMRIIGQGENHWPLVYHKDVGDLYVRLAEHPDASGVYHATDEGDERVNDVAEAIADQAPVRPEIRRVPLAEAQAKLGPLADALVLDQLVRSPRARSLGWAPSLRSVAGSVPRLLEEWRAGRS